jgi:hypothetical protein
MPSVSLIFIDTCAPALSKNALGMCLRGFRFEKVKIFTDTPSEYPGFDCVQIETLASSKSYGDLVLRKVPHFIETDFILIAHYDGFVLNGDQFSPHFYFYDYIGAPWQMFAENCVGNGGFSWRSRRLCEAAASLCAGVDVSSPEDAFICREQRQNLEQSYGCSFPDVNMASHFSFETSVPRYPTFGFHGAFHLPALYRENLEFLIQNVPDRLLVPEDPAAQLFVRHLVAQNPQALGVYQSVLEARGAKARLSRPADVEG